MYRRAAPTAPERSGSWTRETVERHRPALERLAPQALVAFAVETFGDGLTLATSFGPQTIVLMHWLARLTPRTDVFFLDTGTLFPETLALRKRLEARLGLRARQVRPLLSLDQQADRPAR